MRELISRPRRLRSTAALRDLVAEARLDARMLVQPHFVVPGEGIAEEISAMPGIEHQSVDRILQTVEADLALGIRSVLLFGVPEPSDKAPDGGSAFSDTAVVPKAVRALKERFRDDLVVMTDVCLCAYTDHGHCGIIRDGRVDNDATLPQLANMALAHARAGADVVAPSDMMDGRVGAIRDALDAEGHETVAVMSYAAKYASAFYGPFREAAGSAPGMGDRKGYQMDPANGREAVREVAADVAEGADMVMVKPAATYLDVVRRVREHTDLPLAAYHTSGEYSMIKAAAERGWLDERQAALETLTAIARAGADNLITYYATDAARWIQEDLR